MHKVITAMVNSKGEQDKTTLQGFHLICLQDHITGTYCFPKLNEVFGSLGTSTNPNYLTYCSSCGRKLISAIQPLDTTDSLKIKLNQYHTFCKRNVAGELCLNKINDFDSVSSCQSSSNTCSNSACRDAIQTVTTNVGCCVGTWVDVKRAQGSSLTDAQFSESLLCEAAITRCTTSTSPIKLHFKVRNLKWTWYTASTSNKRLADNAITADLAVTVGVVTSAVTITATELPTTSGTNGFHTMAVDSGIQFSTTITIDSDAYVGSTETLLKSSIADHTFSLVTLSTELPIEAKRVAADSIVVSDAEVKTNDMSSSTGGAGSASTSASSSTGDANLSAGGAATVTMTLNIPFSNIDRTNWDVSI
jgi:hypothetical protein